MLEEEYKLEVDIVASGAEVRDLIEKQKKSYQLAIVDIRLDGEKGPDVAKLLLEEMPEGLALTLIS